MSLMGQHLEEIQQQVEDQLGNTLIKPFRNDKSGLSDIVESIRDDEKGKTYQRVKPKILKNSDKQKSKGKVHHVKLDTILSYEP